MSDERATMCELVMLGYEYAVWLRKQLEGEDETRI